MALAGEREGFIPSEGCPFHRKAHPGETFLKRPERPDRSVRPREITAQVGIGIYHDGLNRQLVGHEANLGQCLFDHALKVVLVDGLDGTKDCQGLFCPVREQARLLGHARLLFCFVFNEIGMYQKEPHASSPINMHCCPDYVCIHKVYIHQERGFS